MRDERNVREEEGEGHSLVAIAKSSKLIPKREKQFARAQLNLNTAYISTSFDITAIQRRLTKQTDGHLFLPGSVPNLEQDNAAGGGEGHGKHIDSVSGCRRGRDEQGGGGWGGTVQGGVRR